MTVSSLKKMGLLGVALNYIQWESSSSGALDGGEESIRLYYTQVYISTGPLAQWEECSPMSRETGVQSQVESYQKLKKWYLMPPSLTLNIIR